MSLIVCRERPLPPALADTAVRRAIEIPWLSEKPWEFAHDPARQGFLATEEMHFERNVLT